MEVLGYDELDLVAEVLHNRRGIVKSKIRSGQSLDPFDKLQTPEQRMETLRLQDWQHKNAPLQQAVDRGGKSYPHVYKAHDAGNTLSVHGRKYALPLGSLREEYAVCQ